MFSWLRIFGLLTFIAFGTACTLNQANPATITPVPSPTNLPPSATTSPTSTPTDQPTATDTVTAEPTQTDLPPTSTIQPQDTDVPTPEPNVSLRPPNRRTYAYDKPGTDGNLIRLIQKNQYIRAVGRTSDSTWLQVEFSDSAKGWVTASSVTVTVNIDDLAITGTIIPQDYVVSVRQDADGLRLRQAPYVAENILLFLQAGEPLIVDGRLPDDVWLQVRRTNGVGGWVMRGFVDIPFDINAVPIVEAPPNIPIPTTVVVASPIQSTSVPPQNDVPAIQPTQAPPQIDSPTIAPTLSQPAIIINEAQVSEEGNGLRLRELPSLEARVFFNLEEFTPVTVNGRIADSTWVLIDTPSQGEGWVVTQYLNLFFELSAIPVIENPSPVSNPFAPSDIVEIPNDNVPTSPASGPGNYVFQTGIRGAGNIFLHGQSLGNNPFLFTKVGDSLTATAGFLYHIGWGNYNLGDYGHLQSVVDHFGSSYAHTGKSMLSGWKSYSVLSPELADPSACQPGESPLQCEYRITRPAFALILLGTNDVYEVSPSSYETYLRDIIEISIDNGVVPIVSTVPLRLDFQSQVQAFNGVIRRVVAEYNVPLWDLYNEVFNLPNHGLSSDNVHLSAPAGDLGRTANLTNENLQFGMNARNLSALRILELMLQTYVWG